jgi:hypothetical protein
MLSVGTVIAAITAAEQLTPAFVQLITEVKTLFSAPDQAAIEAALANLDAAADQAHQDAQNFQG